MNIFNTSYLFDGSEQISNLLKQFIGGSSAIFGSDHALILKLQILRTQLYDDTNPQRYQILLQNKFEKILLYTMEISLRRRNFELLESILDLLVTITNNSEEFVTALMDTNFPKLLINCTIVFAGNNNVLKNLTFINLYSIITFNIIRHKKFRQIFQRHSQINKFKSNIIEFLKIKEENVKITSYMILGFLAVNDNDKNVIVKHFDIIEEIVDCLANAYKSITGTYRFFDIWELLIGLEALCDIDEIKGKIIEIKDFIPTIINIASSDSSKSENVSVVLEILENLCTEENIQTRLLSQYHLDRVLDPLTNSGVDSIKMNAKGILSHLNTLCDSNDDGSKYDAVISYCDIDKEVIYKITEKLKESNNLNLARLLPGSKEYKTTINRSNVLIVGVSISFQEDARCLSQVLYAHQSGKMIIPLMLVHKLKLIKQLSSIIDPRQCIDFSDCTMFKEPMAEVVQILCRGRVMNNQSKGINRSIIIENKDGRNVRSSSSMSEMVGKFTKLECSSGLQELKSTGGSNVIQKVGSQILKSDDKNKCSKSDIGKWSKDQVSEWLTDNDLCEIHNKFSTFDGSMLKAILNMRSKTAQTYYQHMETSMGLEFFEILKFDAALDRMEHGTDY